MSFQKKKKKPFVIIIIVLVLAIGIFIFNGKNKKPMNIVASAPVRTVTLSKGDFETTITANGKIASQTSVNITTSLNYKVATVEKEVGDYVNEGDTIITLDSSDIKKEIARLEKQDAEKLEQLQKNVQNAYDGKENAWADYQSAKDAGQDTTQAERQFASANGQYFEAVETLNKGVEDTQLEDLYENLNDCTVKATSSGTITSLNATVGSTVNNSVIAVINDIQNLEVSTTVDEYDIQKISKGMKAVVSTDAVDGTFSATVTAVSLASTDNSGFTVKVTLDESTSSLLIGMNVKVKIILSSEKNVYTVPIDAVETDESGNSYIYVQQKDNTFEKVSVTKKEENDYYAVIEGSDLSDGMIVRASANESEAQVFSDSSSLESQEGFSIQMDGGMGQGGGGQPPMQGN